MVVVHRRHNELLSFSFLCYAIAWLSVLSASLYFSKEALIEIGCVVGRWLVVTRVHCGQTVHPRPIVTMEH